MRHKSHQSSRTCTTRTDVLLACPSEGTQRSTSTRSARSHQYWERDNEKGEFRQFVTSINTHRTENITASWSRCLTYSAAGKAWIIGATYCCGANCLWMWIIYTRLCLYDLISECECVSPCGPKLFWDGTLRCVTATINTNQMIHRMIPVIKHCIGV